MSRAWAVDVRHRSGRMFPRYGLLGIGVIIGSEVLLLAGVEVVGVYFTPLVWTGYILAIDALNLYRRGTSLIVSRRREFLAMLPWSVLCWLIFEAYNLFLRNWVYTGLPESIPLRLLGYGWSFATIFPAILETAELFQASPPRSPAPSSVSRPLLAATAVAGAICLLVPLLVRQEIAGKLFGLVWLGFFLLLDPLNAFLGGPSLLREWRGRDFSRTAALTVSGLVCGILWEFWNYWAIAKWHYAVPLPAGPRIFEMPLLGYLGFIPFAFECFVMEEILLQVVPALRRKGAG